MAYLPEVCATVVLALCSSRRLAALVAAAVDTVEAALVAGEGLPHGQGDATGQGPHGVETEGDYPAAVRSVVSHLAAHLYGPHAHTQYTELELEGCTPGLQGQQGQQGQEEQGHQQGQEQPAAACPGSSSPLAPASSSPPSDHSSSSSQDGSSSEGEGAHSCSASDSGAGGGGGGGSRHASCGSLADVAAEAEAGAAAGTGETQDGPHATGVASTPDGPAGSCPAAPEDAACPYPPALAALERAVASHADLLTALYCLMATSSLAAHLMCPPMGLAMASPAFRAAMTAVQLSDEDVRRLAAGLEGEDGAAGQGQEPQGTGGPVALPPPGAAAAAATAAAVLSCYPAAVSRGLSLDAVYAQLLGLGMGAGMAGPAGQGQAQAGQGGQGCGAEHRELVDSRREFLKQVGGRR